MYRCRVLFSKKNYYYYYYYCYYYYFFNVDFYITFYNNKRPININLPRKWFVINQLTILFLCQYRPFNGENIKENENKSIV